MCRHGALAPDPQAFETRTLELAAPPPPDHAILSRSDRWKPPVREGGGLADDVAKRLIEAERDGSAEGLTWASYDR